MRTHLSIAGLVWATFVSIFAFASPALGRAIGDSYPHMAFHAMSVLTLGLALRLVVGLHASTAGRLMEALRWALTLSLPLAILGNAIELVAAVRRFAADGWVSRPTPDVFEDGAGLHSLAASLTIPSLLLSMLVSLVLVLVTAAQRRTTRVAAD